MSQWSTKTSVGTAKVSRRALLAAAPVALLAGVTGCGGSGGGSKGSSSGTGQASGSTAPTPSSGGKANGSTATLTYAVWDQAQVPAIKKIISAFHAKNPNIQVNVSVSPFDNYFTKLQTAATGGSAADIFWLNISNAEFYAANHVIMPLSDRVKAAGMDMSQHESTIVDAYTFNGVLYGMPKDIDSIALWYNKKLFAAANLKAPDETWTWSDYLGAARALTKNGVFGTAAQLSDQQNTYNTIAQAGGYVISKDRKSSGFDLPDSITGVQFWVDMILKEHVSPTLAQMTNTNPQQMFESGKVAMYYDGAWTVEEEIAVPYAKANAQLAPMPKSSKGSRISVSNGLANCIFAKTKYPDEAWKFVEFFGSKAGGDIQAETGTVIPSFKASQDLWVKHYTQFNASVFTDALKDSYPYPASYNTLVWQNYADKAEIAAWTGKKSVPDVMKDCANQMNSSLAKEPKF